MRVKHKDWSPRAVSLRGGKSLTLPARGIEEISDEDFQSPEFQRLVKSRTVIVLPDENKKPAATEKEPGQPAASPPEGGGGADTGREPTRPKAGPPEGGGRPEPQ